MSLVRSAVWTHSSFLCAAVPEYKIMSISPAVCDKAGSLRGLQALEKLSDNALVEFAPFAATLAQRLARLVSSARLAPGQPLWTLAVDSFLLRACDTEGQVMFLTSFVLCR